MPNEQEKYEGWANYETWCVSLWLTNDEGLYNNVRELVRDAKNTNRAAEAIKEFVEELNPLADQATVFADLMNAALSAVDWSEIVEDFSAE